MNPLELLDLELLDGLTELAPLVAQYLKEHKDARVEASADDFQRWLKRDAIPLMERQAAAIFDAVVSAKVETRERFDRLERLLEEIRDGMAVHPGVRVWRSLSELERAMLTLAYDKAEATIAFDDSIECKVLAPELQASADDVYRAAKLLHEHKLAQVYELTGDYCAVRWLDRGISLAWTSLHGRERVAGERRLVAALPQDSGSARLRDVAQRAALAPGLTWVALQEWESGGLLTIQRYDGARDRATIFNVTETLRREVLA